MVRVRSGVGKGLPPRTRFIGVFPSHRMARVFPLTHWGATLELWRWPTALGPPLGPMPGHLSPDARPRGPSGSASGAGQSSLKMGLDDFQLQWWSGFWSSLSQRGDHLGKMNAAVLMLVRLSHAAVCVT